jgi:hypothetical protein
MIAHFRERRRKPLEQSKSLVPLAGSGFPGPQPLLKSAACMRQRCNTLCAPSKPSGAAALGPRRALQPLPSVSARRNRRRRPAAPARETPITGCRTTHPPPKLLGSADAAVSGSPCAQTRRRGHHSSEDAGESGALDALAMWTARKHKKRASRLVSPSFPPSPPLQLSHSQPCLSHSRLSLYSTPYNDSSPAHQATRRHALRQAPHARRALRRRRCCAAARRLGAADPRLHLHACRLHCGSIGSISLYSSY